LTDANAQDEVEFDMNRFRGLISALLAVGVTFGLFLFMFKLISSGGNNNEERPATTTENAGFQNGANGAEHADHGFAQP
jgi:hypothetical protein